MVVSNRAEDILVTYSLGSCIGLTLYDPVAVVGGMVHCMLPLSSLDPTKASTNPCMFADTGVAALLKAVFDLGAERQRVVAKVAGAAVLLDDGGRFRIGERNYTVVQRILAKNEICIAAEDIGDTVPRTMYLQIETGMTIVRSRGQGVEL
jgi:chemotaxis protein CheD